MKLFRFNIINLIITFCSISVYAQQNNCDEITNISIEKLTPLFESNDFEQVENLLNTIEMVCGESELTYRIKILRNLIERKNADALIDYYVDKMFDKKFTNRLDQADKQNHKAIYEANKALFNFVPLKHPIDQSTKRKAVALLSSSNFSLSPKEEMIALLFADRVQEFYDNFDKVFKKNNNQAVVPVQTDNTQTSPLPPQTLKPEVYDNSYIDRSKIGFSITAGAYMPLGAVNPVFSHNALLGLSVTSPLRSSFIFEGFFKVRINKNDRDFDYKVNNEIFAINSPATYLLGGNVGYKVFDNDRFVIYPKIGLAFESTTTGLSETFIYDDGFQETQYNNLNTINFSPGVTFMRAMSRKTFVGINANYHYSPYNWDSNLVSKIFRHYTSLEFFIRF